MRYYRGVARIHQLLRDALAYPSDGAEAALERHLCGRGARGFRALDRELRSRTAYTAVGIQPGTFAELVASRTERLPTAVWCCLTMQRDGHLRQRAIEELAKRTGRTPLAAVINRCADPVAQVGEAARAVLPLRLAAADLADIVWCLPLVDLVLATARGAAAGVLDALDLRLRQDRVETDRAMRDGVSHEESEVRLSALQHFLRLGGEAEQIRGMFERGLADPSPRARLWAARAAAALCDPETLAPLLHRMASDKSPGMRLVALRAYNKQRIQHRVEAACFDHNANVRFYARRYVRKFDSELDYRQRALGCLMRDGAGTLEYVGALAVLSEFGRAADRPLVEGFRAHPRRVVRREAARTLALMPE